jgi:hypothetical protein
MVGVSKDKKISHNKRSLIGAAFQWNHQGNSSLCKVTILDRSNHSGKNNHNGETSNNQIIMTMISSMGKIL